MDHSELDLIVIGAGINGAAIAREAALRRLKVFLVEQADLCSGTSARSSRLIHGGLRYLEHGELPLVYESLAEREALLRLAPHLVQPLALCIPIYAARRRRPWQIRLGLTLYDLLSRGKSLPDHQMLSKEAMAERLPGLETSELTAGALFFDAQVPFPERLVVENVVDAVAHGARLATYHRVTGLIIEEHRVRGVRWRDRDGAYGEARSRVVINASGPWVDQVLEGVAARPLIGGTKGSHLIVEPFANAPSAAVYVEAISDGRPFFIIPWNGLYLIGTTDQRYQGDPDRASISDTEYRYLLSETRRVFPAAADVTVHYTQTAVRPLPYHPRGDAGAITRRHVIRHHRNARGLYSVVGGKLTTHRALAQDVMRRIAGRLGLRREASPTQDRPLPGYAPDEQRRELLETIANRLGGEAARRLWGLYGVRANRIFQRIAEAPELSREICPHSHATVAELVHAVESEWALTLLDILQRRCMAGLSKDLGLSAADSSARWLVRLGVWDQPRAEQELADYRDYAERALFVGAAVGPR